MEINRKYQSRKRIIPKIYIKFNDNYNFNNIIELLPPLKKAIIEETIKAIEYGVRKKQNTIELFEINNTNKCFYLDRKNWKPSLEKIMNYYIKEEEYNKCIEIQELIKKI